MEEQPRPSTPLAGRGHGLERADGGRADRDDPASVAAARARPRPTRGRNPVALGVHRVRQRVLLGHRRERVEADHQLDLGDVDALERPDRANTAPVRCSPAVGAAADPAARRTRSGSARRRASSVWMYGGSGISPYSSSRSRASRSPSRVTTNVSPAAVRSPTRTTARPSRPRRAAPAGSLRAGRTSASHSRSALVARLEQQHLRRPTVGAAQPQAGGDHLRLVHHDEVARGGARRAGRTRGGARSRRRAHGRRAAGPRRGARSEPGRCAPGRAGSRGPPGARPTRYGA